MEYRELLKKLESAYSKNYNDQNAIDIINLLQEKKVSESACDLLYNLLVRNCEYFPKVSKFEDILSKNNIKINNNDQSLHEQSSYQMVAKYKHKDITWLINTCKWIRQEKEKRSLKSSEISFLYHWENLSRVAADFQEICKQKIINQESIDDLIIPENITVINKTISECFPTNRENGGQNHG